MSGAVAALAQVIARHFPQVKEKALHPPWLLPYNPYACGAIFSLEFFPEGRSHDDYCMYVADSVAEVYEQCFAAGDEAFVHLWKESPHGLMAPDADEVPMDAGGAVDIARFTEPIRSTGVDLESELPLLHQVLGSGTVAAAEFVECVNPFGTMSQRYDYELDEGEDDQDLESVELVCRIAPLEIDYHTLFLAQAHQDFPSEGRPRSGWALALVNAGRPTILDMRDDRYLGVGAPEADPLRSLYERYAPLLNDYRRDEMTATFGHWPKPARV